MQSAMRVIGAAFCFAITATAQVPQLISYQGRVSVGGTNFDGTAQFKFALVNGTGATYWSSGGVSLPVSQGLYSVLLGDATLPNMPVIPVTVFTNADVRLRVWFDDGVNGLQQLSPDQRIAAVGYALMAANVADGAITSAKIAAGAVTADKIPAGAVGPVQLAPDSALANLNASSGASLTNLIFLGSFNGDGAGLTSVNAAQVGGLDPELFLQINETRAFWAADVNGQSLVLFTNTDPMAQGQQRITLARPAGSGGVYLDLENLNKGINTNYAAQLRFWRNGIPLWEIGMDGTGGDDLALYGYRLHADFLRVATNHVVLLGPAVGSAEGGTGQLTIFPDSTHHGVEVDGGTNRLYGNVYLAQKTPNKIHTKIFFRNRWELGNDSGYGDNREDFYLKSLYGKVGYPFVIDAYTLRLGLGSSNTPAAQLQVAGEGTVLANSNLFVGAVTRPVWVWAPAPTASTNALPAAGSRFLSYDSQYLYFGAANIGGQGTNWVRRAWAAW